MNELCLFKSSKHGSYFLSSNFDFSAYQGFFVFHENNWDLFKVIDRVSGNFNVSISDKTLFLESDESQDVVIDLDFRPIHDFDDKGRIYTVYEKDDFLIIKYEKFFDDSLNSKKFTKFLAIKGLNSFDLLKEWIKKNYSYDAERKTVSELYVFRLLKANVKKIVFGFGANEEEAIFSSLVNPISSDETFFENVNQLKLVDETKQLNQVGNAFNSCVKFNKKKEPMIFAGYPWFYQVWSRDECISLIGLFYLRKFDVAKNIILRCLKNISENGILPNRFPESKLGSADATGWLFQRISLFFDSGDLNFSSKELLLIEEKLDCFLSACKKKSFKGLVYSGPKETWMDTEGPDGIDVRSGARVEIQALYLAALELKIKLRKFFEDDDSVSKWTHNLNKKKYLVRKQLVEDDVLCDGFDNGLDFTLRPNVFLACYAFPGLVSRSQWVKTFDRVLDACWLDWGGLSSIDKRHELFCAVHTGIDNRSYHRGDSWFFVNNIAALAMIFVDKKRFSSKINMLKNASLTELFESGAEGFCAEISSANSLTSKGCLSQAWSSATLLELLLK